ncbi:sigma-70 family RNA polymerase sigma factor [Microvirga yunnanensis]|uniref:sigma-70 family RNA polymerase sigma factor n=1 Tax=Microvirga yunnanensis TaxID=2953740 RepID=UPI0021C9DA17|nr:sigma-70 family RNA polymerase sigma factor [Microvirga sp. HBU67655]
MTTAARQHSRPALRDTDRRHSARGRRARLRHIHPLSHARQLALVEEVRTGRRSKHMRDQLSAFLPHLRAFALHLTHDPVRSDDLVQTTVLRAWANLDHFRHGTSLEAWLFTILRNSFYSEHRKYRREIEDPDSGFARRLMVQPEQEFRLMLGDLQKALGHLAPEQRETYEDAAALCGVAVGTLKSRVNRARTQLAAMLQMENRHDLGPDRLMQAALQHSLAAESV